MNYSNHDVVPADNRILQPAAVVWFTGLSGAGKSTLARGLQRRFRLNGYASVVLDGDELRDGLNAELGFSKEARMENIRRAAEVAKILIKNDIFCVVSTISPYPEMREKARKIIGEASFVEVFVNAPLAVCEERDVKGFYKRARQNLVTDFTGVQDAYIPPESPHLEIRTDILSVENAVSEIYTCLEAYAIHSKGIGCVRPGKDH
jgi:adenylylsulfate kinase